MPSIELKSISGKGIKSLKLFQQPSLYAVISLTNDKKKIDKKKTAVDRSNGENPDWDQPIKIDIDGNVQDLVLQFELKADALLGDRVVGRAFIPAADLDFCGGVRHVSYQLKTPEGKPNGILNFSYKISGFVTAQEPVPVPVSSPASTPMARFHSLPAEQVSLYPPPAVLYPQQSMASRYYPTIEPPAVYPLPSVYPPPAAGSGYYPPMPEMPESRVSYPPPARPLDHGLSFHTPGYYPPLPEVAHAVYPPRQEPECCYRSNPEPATGWYPAVEQPAPGWYPSAPPAPEEYGYRQRGLYGYN